MAVKQTSKETPNKKTVQKDASSVTLQNVSKSYGEAWLSDDVLKDVSIEFPGRRTDRNRWSIRLWQINPC